MLVSGSGPATILLLLRGQVVQAFFDTGLVFRFGPIGTGTSERQKQDARRDHGVKNETGHGDDLLYLKGVAR